MLAGTDETSGGYNSIQKLQATKEFSIVETVFPREKHTN